MADELLIGLKEAGKRLGLSHWSLRIYIKQGRLSPVRCGRRVLLEPAELQRFVNELKGRRN